MVLGIKSDIVEKYCKYIEKEFSCKTSEEFLGKRYVIGEEFGIGNFSTMKIEDGLEISISNMYKADTYFDNRNYKDEILEVSYCYSGIGQINTLPHNEEYIFKEGHICIYKGLNDVEYFKFKYDKCKTVSVHMNFSTVKNIVNPIWEDKMIIDWENNINKIFKEDILIIEKASYEMKKIAEEIGDISINSMLDYMKLKLKTIEFLATFFEEKCNKKPSLDLPRQETEIIVSAKEIINRSFPNILSVKELACNLNISIYKLQEEFKNITGYTVYEYIKKLKIEKAKDLLKNTDMSMLQIANEIGYENPSKFASAFKEYNKITPLKYKKLNMYK
ncbi:AraC family transcriptional regulator [Clostridium tetanomorphum]|uniref:Helix-turn-helix transcriptional regulator n=1 Tax=Clostridium tetanomorphum TaxID=1553 RepID=A0A923E6K6_CLOTT|nr:AraC family transcriptional regulator [Clostridium tetanomorphum]MBC2396172.1 helix-turn-helix transcriptional regulator [Clostridium tetanomorphum]